MRTVNGEYLMGVYVINKAAYYGEDMEMAVWINEKGKLRYNYWFDMLLPRIFEVSL